MMPKDKKSIQNRKVYFSNKAISKIKCNGPRVIYKFIDPPEIIKNIQLRISKGKKVYVLRYTFKGRQDQVDLGEHIPGLFDTLSVTEKMTDILKHCKNVGYTKWIKDPKHHLGFKEYDHKFTLRDIIEEMVKANFPRKGLTGTVTAVSQRTNCRYLIGYNKRIDHLEHFDDIKGWGVTRLKETSAIKTWDQFFKTFKHGTHVKKSSKGDMSLYDSKLSGEYAVDVTATQIEDYIDKPGRSFGTKDQIKDCLSSLWNFARKNKMLGKNPTDPTKGIILTQDEEPNSAGSIYNHFKFTLDQLQVLYNGLLDQIKTTPFPALAILMLMVTGMRKSTVCKLTYDMITEDENGSPIFKIPRRILKGRSKAGQEDEVHDITASVREVINLCIKERKKNYKYMHTKYLFPSKLINKDKLMNPGEYPEYADSYLCRLSERTLIDCWNILKENTGIKEGAIKSLRKTYSSLAVEISGGAHRGILLTRHKTQGVLEKHYNKFKRKEVSDLAKKLDNVIRFKKIN